MARTEIIEILPRLRKFMSSNSIASIGHGLRGEEGMFFKSLLLGLAERLDTMPKTYEQDGVDDPIAYLHYFLGGSDWYITERDSLDVQHQAFGYAVLNGDLQNAEMGYISITELIGHQVELDLYFQPTSLKAIKAGIEECA